MIIAGFQKTSLVDYPKHICATIFTAGCNMRCPYCHNAKLVSFKQDNIILEEDVLSYLEEKKHLLDGICITGGEPTLQKDLLSFILKVKSLGLKVKLDSNGSTPAILEKLIPYVDFVAMDIKQVPGKYSETVKAPILPEDIMKSISLLQESGVDYEFRTTVVPECTSKEDILAIGKLLKGSKKYCLQQFVPSKEMFDTTLSKRFSKEELEALASILSKDISLVEVRA